MQKLIEDYVNLIKEKGENGEKYKWEAIDHFQKHWSIDAENFYEMFNEAFRKRGNLFYLNSWGYIHTLANKFPEKTRLMFSGLFNEEEEELAERIKNFQDSARNLLPDIKKLMGTEKINDQQDERTLSVYLSFKYPEKYFIYKASFYENFCKILNVPVASKFKKYLHYLELAKDFTKKYVSNNEKLLKLHNTVYPLVIWNSENLITQNILFLLLEKPDDLGKYINGNSPISLILINITWNSSDWKTESNDPSNHGWVKMGNVPHESWNFEFENKRNTPDQIFGFAKFTHAPSLKGDNNLIIFHSKGKIIGFYGKAEILHEPVSINENESYNLIGRKDLSLVLENKIENLKAKGYLEDKERMGQIGFVYLNNLETADKILREAILLNPNQEVKLQSIRNWILGNVSEQNPHNANYWIFQGNPKYFRVIDALKDNIIKTWTVSAHKNEIRIGDKVILWLTGDNSGCYALCKVISNVENKLDDKVELDYYTGIVTHEPTDKVDIEIEYNWWDQPILKQELINLPDFEKFYAGKQGTNFSSSKVQYENILQIHCERSLKNAFTKVGDRGKINQFLDLLLLVTEKFNLTNDDPRISFSTPKIPKKYISATVGQRYILSLENINNGYPDNFEYAFIAAQEKSEEFKNSRGFKKFGEFTTVSSTKIPPFYAYFNESLLPVKKDLQEAWLFSIGNELERVEKSSYRQHHNPFFFNAVIDKEYRMNLLDNIFKSSSMKSNKLNQILFGPPGTGKTFRTINEALKIVDPEFYETNKGNRDLLKKRFRELTITDWKKATGQIVFCTFHQSFSYEDFVEGIKPVLKNENDDFLKYEIEDGVFKRICRLSMDNKKSVELKTLPIVSFTEEEFKNALFYKLSLGDINDTNDDEIYRYCIENECISIGFGQGEDFNGLNESQISDKCKELKFEPSSAQALNYFIHYLKNGNYVIISKGNRYIRAMGKVIGEYKFIKDSPIRHKHFREVKWIFKDEEIPVNEVYDRNLTQTTIYKLDERGIRENFFINTAELINSEAESEIHQKNYVLIIDEINRGNISSIFGELITLIETDKRAGSVEELEVLLPYSKVPFKVPANVYIIGTMNTADRSIEALDTALRRRFSFSEIAPDSELIKNEGTLAPDGMIENIDIVKMLETINFRIEKLIDKDHRIGHAYFLYIEKNKKALEDLFADKVIPLLEEYFFGDFGKIGLVLGETFVEKVSMNGFDFAPFPAYGDMVTDLKEKSVYRIKSKDKWDFTSVY